MRAVWVLAFGLGACPVWANDWTPQEIAELAAEAQLDVAALTIPGDAEYGAYLGGECTTCHQSNGDGDGIPAIIYLDDVSFRIAMHEYKAKSRDHPVMQMIAGRLGDEEIAALAVYFSALGEEQ